MIKRIREIFTRDMIRPLIYKSFTRFILMLLAVLLAQCGAFWPPSKEETRVSA